MDVLRLTLRQLQIFVAVARAGSTNAAAAEVALSQSATSAALIELERALSVSLFDRAGKRLLLNDNGQTLLPRALALLDGAAQIETQARSGAAQLQALRMGASTTLGNYLLPEMLERLYSAGAIAQAHSWQSRVLIANTASIGQRVASFELDIGFVEGPVHEADLESIPWVLDEMVIVGSAQQHPHGYRTPLRALREAVWLLREPGSGTREVADQALLPHLHGYRRSIELGSSEAIKHAAARGLGLACLSQWVVQDMVQADRLRVLTTALPKVSRPCYVVTHRAKSHTAAMRLIFNHLGVRPPQH